MQRARSGHRRAIDERFEYVGDVAVGLRDEAVPVDAKLRAAGVDLPSWQDALGRYVRSMQ